jgi:hypothetical protein
MYINVLFDNKTNKRPACCNSVVFPLFRRNRGKSKTEFLKTYSVSQQMMCLHICSLPVHFRDILGVVDLVIFCSEFLLLVRHGAQEHGKGMVGVV